MPVMVMRLLEPIQIAATIVQVASNVLLISVHAYVVALLGVKSKLCSINDMML